MISPYKAIKEAGERVKNIPLNQISVGIIQDIQTRIWNAGNWSWTVGEIGVNASPTSSEFAQDYLISDMPPDVARFIDGRLIIPQLGDTRNDTDRTLKPVSYLMKSNIVGQPSMFAVINQESPVIRFNVGFNEKGAEFYGYYKKKIPVYDAKTIHDPTTIPLPDGWFYVLKEGVLWKVLAYADDERAGTIQVTDNKTAVTGQAAIFYSALNEMAAKEPRIISGYREVVEKEN